MSLSEFYISNNIIIGNEPIILENIEFPEYRNMSIDTALETYWLDKCTKITNEDEDLKKHFDNFYKISQDMEIDIKKKYKDVESILIRLSIVVIKLINNTLHNKNSIKSISEHRNICINDNFVIIPGLATYLRYKLIMSTEDPIKTANSFSTDYEYEKSTYGGCVFAKLEELGKIYKFKHHNGNGYYIQA